MDRPKISICGFEIEWDLERGLNLWAGTPALSMWIPTTVAGLMSGLQRMVGTERFNLCLQQGGIESVEGDWGVITSQPTFEAGMAVMSGVASSAGWGRWEVVSLDREKKEARLRALNSWEGIYQRALGVSWGSGMVAGKFAGLCTRLFGTPCWAEQTAFSALGGDFDEFLVRPTDTTIEQRLEALLSAGQATSADLAVALTKLREEVRERERTEERVDGGDQDQRDDECDRDVDAEEEAGEEEILKPSDVCGGAGDEFSGVGAVVVGEGQALHGVVDGAANVEERALNEPIADWAEDVSIDGPKGDEEGIAGGDSADRDGDSGGGVEAVSLNGFADPPIRARPGASRRNRRACES